MLTKEQITAAALNGVNDFIEKYNAENGVDIDVSTSVDIDVSASSGPDATDHIGDLIEIDGGSIHGLFYVTVEKL